MNIQTGTSCIFFSALINSVRENVNYVAYIITVNKRLELFFYAHKNDTLLLYCL